MPRNDIFLLLFWSFTYIFLKKTGPLDAPRVDARGRGQLKSRYSEDQQCLKILQVHDHIPSQFKSRKLCTYHLMSAAGLPLFILHVKVTVSVDLAVLPFSGSITAGGSPSENTNESSLSLTP